MTKEEAIQILKQRECCMECVIENCTCAECDEAFEMAINALEHDIDFDKEAEKVIEETVASVWGKPPYTEVLDKIKADVEQYQADCDLSCSDDANCRTCDRITFDTIYRIIDKYRKGQTDADSD